MREKYTIKREMTTYDGITKTVEHTFEAVTLDEVLENVLYFLNGCSFSYLKDLIYVKEDGTEHPVLDWKTYPSEEESKQLTMFLDDLFNSKNATKN